MFCLRPFVRASPPLILGTPLDEVVTHYIRGAESDPLNDEILHIEDSRKRHVEHLRVRRLREGEDDTAFADETSPLVVWEGILFGKHLVVIKSIINHFCIRMQCGAAGTVNSKSVSVVNC